MKKIFTILAFASFLASSLEINAQTVRRVLIEEFTGESCPPCATYNPAFDALVEHNVPKALMLKYQVNIPVAGPMYNQNPSEVTARRTYYAVNSAPNFRMDGAAVSDGHPVRLTQAVIDARASVMSNYEIKIEHNLNNTNDSVSISVNVKNVGTAASVATHRLHIALIEKEINFTTPPGTNGELHFISVMRKMIPDVNGTALPAINAGETKDYAFTIKIPTYVYNYGKLGIVAFVQDQGSKQVMQSAESLPKPLVGNFLDAGLELTLGKQNNLCDYTIEASAKIKNNGSTPITAGTIDLRNGTTLISSKTFSGTINAGETSADIAFNNVNLTPGRQVKLNAVLKAVNTNGNELDKLNNGTNDQVFYTVQVNPSGETLNEPFNVSANRIFPAHCIVSNLTSSVWNLTTIDRAGLGTLAPADGSEMGGFGQSVFSMFLYYINYAPGQKTWFMFDKIDLTNSIKTELTFSHAYGYNGEGADNVLVEISKDCGATWKTVYNKSGEDLKTVDVNPGDFFAPAADQWVKNTINISEFDGAREIIVRFVATAHGDGNNAFIDDIGVNPGTSGTDNPGIISSINVYPNPAVNDILVEINLAKSSVADVEIMDLSGKVISTLSNNISLNQGFNRLNYNLDLNSGVYLARVKTNEGIVTKRVTIL